MAHGKNLKRRGTQKVVRRTRNRLTFINKQLGDAKLRQRWDYKLTTRQNYARLGLVFNLNSVKKIGMGSAESKRQCDELFGALECGHVACECRTLMRARVCGVQTFLTVTICPTLGVASTT